MLDDIHADSVDAAEDADANAHAGPGPVAVGTGNLP